MNGKTWTANPLLLGLLLLALGAPCAEGAGADSSQAGAGEHEGPETSPEVKVLGDLNHLDAPAEGWFKADPDYTDEKYDAEAQLYIYAPRPEPENRAST
jgi:hypothetical protein